MKELKRVEVALLEDRGVPKLKVTLWDSSRGGKGRIVPLVRKLK